MTEQEMIELIDSRINDVITDSNWFEEKVRDIVKEQLEDCRIRL